MDCRTVSEVEEIGDLALADLAGAGFEVEAEAEDAEEVGCSNPSFWGGTLSRALLRTPSDMRVG